jgi:uncharacterized repeat protein (TIGR03803 family)
MRLLTASKRHRNYCEAILVALAVCTFAAVAAQAQTFTVLADFDYTNGREPQAGVVQGLDGNLYGTTYDGEGNGGNVFKITPKRILTTFSNTGDGTSPYAPLVLGTDGNFYSTTVYGGTSNYGTVFEVTASGTPTTLYSFCVNGAPCMDGQEPFAPLVQGTDGNFYGTTSLGGASTNCSNGCGTVFRITPAGTLTTLHSFTQTDGVDPNGVVEGNDGNFYGTTYGGGSNNIGTVFKITPGGKLTTIHEFAGYPNDGGNPTAGLVLANNGDFYGTTLSFGSYEAGTVFEINSSGKYNVLYNFTGGADGGDPEAALIQASNGNFYGTTNLGGQSVSTCNGGAGCGTIFEITSGGTLTTLHDFCEESGCPDGAYLTASLFQGTNGILYGTSPEGGNSDFDGTVFSWAAGLRRFVQPVPTSGEVGSAVTILGNDLTGTTGVSFNGTAAMFTVVSATEITTTVPTDATTGKITVTLEKGSLSSNVAFRVP